MVLIAPTRDRNAQQAEAIDKVLGCPHRPYEGSQLAYSVVDIQHIAGRPHRPYEGSQRGNKLLVWSEPYGPHRPYEGSQHQVLRVRAQIEGSSSCPHRPYEGSQPA